MPATTRVHTILEVAICILLLAEACSSSSDESRDASQALDGRGDSLRDSSPESTAADVPAVVDTISTAEAASGDRPASDEPTLSAGDTPGGDGAITDTPAVDGPATAETAIGDLGTVCTGEYISCGCGCCGGKPANTACYFPSRGQTIATVAAHERAMTNPDCSSAGCSAGTRYVCCLELPEEASSSASSYTAEWGAMATGLAGLKITKKGADCATIHVFSPGENYTAISTSLLNWGLSVVDVGTCGDAGAGQRAGDGIGRITVTPTGGTRDAIYCTVTRVSIHATVYGTDENGSVKAVRMDAENLVVKPLASCLL